MKEKLRMIKHIFFHNKYKYVRISGGGYNLSDRDKRNIKITETLKGIFERSIPETEKEVAVGVEKNSNIFFCWLQGIENAPQVVKVCYDKLLKNCGGREVILITNENLSQYVKLPEYIIDKWRSGIMSNTHFADLIRVELLCNYGGFWVDSTAFITNCRIFDKCEKSELAYASFCSIYPMNNWFLYARKNDRILTLVKNCLLDYWKNSNGVLDYFLWQMFALFAYEYYKEKYKKIYVVSHEAAHYLASHLLFTQFNKSDYQFLIKHFSDIHKLSYKKREELTKLNGTYYDILINKNEF